MNKEDILMLIIVFLLGVITMDIILSVYDINKFTDKNEELMDDYDVLRNDWQDILKDNYELRMNLSELEWKLYLTEKQIPAYIKHLNNTNNYSSCWTENGTTLEKRKDDCYNCQNFTEDYLDNIKDEEYETYYISGHIEGHEFSHAFAKVCIYINPTENELMSNRQLGRYEIIKEELWRL